MELAADDDATVRVSQILRWRVVESLPLEMTPEEFVRGGYGSYETIACGLGHHPEPTDRVWNALAEGLPDSAAVLVIATTFAAPDPAT